MNTDNILKIYEEVKDDIKFLGISSVRMKIMLCLNDGPKKTKQLRKLTGMQSSTILHGINELEKHNLVLREGNTFHLSEMGIVILPKLVDITKTIFVLENNCSLWLNHEIQSIPPDLLMEIGCLSDSEVVEADITDIMKTHGNYLDMVSKSKRVKGVSSFIHPEYVGIYTDLMKNNGVKVELVLTDKVIKEMIKSIDTKGLKDFISLYTKGNLTLWRLDEEVKVAFTVTDKFLSLGLYKKDGRYDSLRDLVSENSDSIKWGNKLFDHYQKKADKIELKRLDKFLSALI